MNKQVWMCFTIILAVAFTGPAFAADLYVPSEFATIQAAIDAAEEGDRIWISDGTYSGPGNTDLDPLGKGIAIRSVNGSGNCTILCSNGSRGFNIHSGETDRTVILGLKIRFGQPGGKGGGIYIEQSSPSISECTISQCSVYNGGGGVYAVSGSPWFDSCVFEHNTSYYMPGGGISLEDCTGVYIVGCRISGNDGGGGGVHGDNSEITIVNSIIESNRPQLMGNFSGVRVANNSILEMVSCSVLDNSGGEKGGGIAVLTGSSAVLYGCRIEGNSVSVTDNVSAALGGGLYLDGAGEFLVSNCIFRWNEASGLVTSGPCLGGGVYCIDTQGVFENCLVRDNSIDQDVNGKGGGFWIEDSTVWIRNSTVTSNVACNQTEAGGIAGKNSSIYFRNSIIWGNGLPGMDFQNVITDAEYCDYDYILPGAGNIRMDPEFVSCSAGPCFLSQRAAGQNVESPCVNAGSDLSSEVFMASPSGPVYMSSLFTRTDMVPDAGIVDMGYHHPVSAAATATPEPTWTPPATPDSTWTPTELPGTATPAPTPCSASGCTVIMPAEHYRSGDRCYCDVLVCNSEVYSLINYPVFVFLDVYGEYFFAPDFSGFCHYTLTIAPGETRIPVLEEFFWPSGAGTADDLCWYAAVTDPGISVVWGEIGSFTFGWGE